MDDFIRPTTHCWQTLLPAGAYVPEPPYRYTYPARLPDGRYLELPLRRLPNEPEKAVASLIANHASFEVVDALAAHMAELARALEPEVIVGLPTLGLTFAPLVARHLGFSNYVPLGYSRKYWYDDALSLPVRSITSPSAEKRLFIDPNIVPRLRHRRVVLVDDVISTGQTALAALALTERLQGDVRGLVVAMVQGTRWKESFRDPGLVRGVISSPRFIKGDNGWLPEYDSTLRRP